MTNKVSTTNSVIGITPLKVYSSNTSFEIENSIISTISIYQSIDTILPKVTVNVRDPRDLRETYDLRGGFKVDMELFDGYGFSTSNTYLLNEVGELTTDQTGQSILQFGLLREPYLYTAHKRVYKGFSDQTPSQVLGGMIPSLKTVPTQKMEFINGAGMTINQLAKKLGRKAISGKGDVGFLFYETLNAIHFVPVNHLITEPGYEIETYEVGMNPTYKNSIIDMREIRQYKALYTMNRNLFNNETVWFDYKTKMMVQQKIDPRELRLSRSDLFLDDLNIMMNNSKRKDVGGSLSIENMKASDILLQRFGKKYHVLVNGSFDLYPGKMIDIRIPRKFQTGELSTEHNGRYLITRTAHHIHDQQMKVKMEVVRNSRD